MATNPGEYKYPVFDCERNQDNSCKKEERISAIGIKAAGTKTPPYRKIKGYKPCTICRGVNDMYESAVWFSMQTQTKNFDANSVMKKAKAFRMLYGDNFRIRAYPAFSASFEDAESDLEELEQEGFYADVVCYDYFDISNPGKGASGFSERGVADYVWKRGKGLAARKHFLLATVLQSNRKSISKKSLEQEDTGEDIRKLAHPDEVFSLNQTKEEKDQGIMRWGVIAHRHEDFSFKGEVMVLQNYGLGQPFLDAEWVTRKADE